MKGLLNIPTTQDLSSAYEALQFQKSRISEQNLALWSQWARFDPRLGEILATWISAHWRSINPMLLNEHLCKMPWPSSLGPILEQLHIFRINQEQAGNFKLWANLIMSSVAPAHFEMYFIGTLRPGGKTMRKISERPHKSFLRWGYLGDELFFNKAARLAATRTLVPPEIRKARLRDLLKRKKRITVSDYLAELGGAVSRRQAELDLKDFGLKAHGNTRARTYTRR